MIEKFRRITSGGGYIAEVDGLRFIAIMAVLLNHVAGIAVEHGGIDYGASGPGGGAYALLRMGRYGVHLFFVISGFILAMPFLRANLPGGRPVSLRRYFLRRLTRLEPPYVIILLLYFVMLVALGQYGAGELFPHLLASLVYSHNFIYAEPSWVNGVAWSLEIEVQFYVLLPLLMLLLKTKTVWLRRALLGAAICLLAIWRFQPAGEAVTILRYLHFFLLGVLVADFHLGGFFRIKSWRGDVVLLFASLLMFVYFFRQPVPLPKDFLVVALFAVLFTAAFCGRWTSAILAYPWVSVVGGMCYSIYLLHAQIIGFCIRFLFKGHTLGYGFWPDFLVLSAVLVPVIAVVSGVFFWLIERPCMHADWPQRLAAFLRIRAGRKPA